MQTFCSLFISRRPQETDPPSERPHLLHNLLLHQVQAHGHQRHPQQDVHGADDQLGVGLFLVDIVTHVKDVVVAGDEIAEADGQEAGEAEVGTVQVTPTFPGSESYCT